MLGIKIADEDVKKEDVSFDLDGKKILCEIKGKNTDITKEYVSQTNSHIIADASKNNVADDDIKNIYKGLLIVNPFIKETLKGKIKKDLYSQEAIRDIKYFKICTIDTLTLLTMYSKFKENNSSINLKDIILTEDYIKPNFEDII